MLFRSMDLSRAELEDVPDILVLDRREGVRDAEMFFRHLLVTEFHPCETALVQVILECEGRAPFGLPRQRTPQHRTARGVLQGGTGLFCTETMARHVVAVDNLPEPAEVRHFFDLELGRLGALRSKLDARRQHQARAD